MSKARLENGKEERGRKLENEVEKERETNRRRGNGHANSFWSHILKA